MYSNLQPSWLSGALIAAAMPTGINVYLFGLRYDTGSAPAATAILLSSGVLVVNVAVVLLFLACASQVFVKDALYHLHRGRWRLL